MLLRFLKTGFFGPRALAAACVTCVMLAADPALARWTSLPEASTDPTEECVILLHGMTRTSNSMNKIERDLVSEGYLVANVGFPSRKHDIPTLAEMAVGEGVNSCRKREARRISFVTHSVGGILVRYYLSRNALPELGRVVMMAPPNQGSQLIDHARKMSVVGIIMGPAGHQLGTGLDSVPLQLPAANFSVGVIAGTKTFNPLMSAFLPNPDDGKVTVESTKLAGMQDFIIVPYSHALMMRKRGVREQVIRFLRYGQFRYLGG